MKFQHLPLQDTLTVWQILRKFFLQKLEQIRIVVWPRWSLGKSSRFLFRLKLNRLIFDELLEFIDWFISLDVAITVVFLQVLNEFWNK